MTRNGIAYPLQPLVPLTGGTGSGLLPTPDTGLSPNGHGRRGGKPGNGRQSGASLDAMARYGLWPTPTKADAERKSETYYRGEGNPTLLGAVRNWPTPNARDYKGSPGQGSRDRGGRGASLPGSIKDSEGSGSLNPMWVEWLMGFPTGWTVCEPSVTPSSPKSQNGSVGD
jgi:hypothetical protein